MKKSEIFFDILLIPIDILMIITAFIAAYYLRAGSTALPVAFSEYIKWVLVTIPIWILVFAIAGLYHKHRHFKVSDEIYNIFAACSIGIMITVVIIFMRREFFFSRLIILYAWFLSVFFVLLGRAILEQIQHWLFRYGIGVHKVLIIGGGQVSTTQVLQEIEKNPLLGYKPIGALDEVEKIGIKINGVKVIGRLSDLEEIYKKYKFNDIIQTRSLDSFESLKVINFCRIYRIKYRFKPDLFEIKISHVKPTEIGRIPLIELQDIALEGWGRAIKRFIDLIFSILGLAILSPILIIIAILVKITSKGPIFYRQRRVGLVGKVFDTIKFRSMYVTSSDGSAEKETGPVRAHPDDQRRTPLGKVIRRFSIDELPQLINVLKGEMSIVGPRPERPEFVKNYVKDIPGYESRHRVKPGLTGWAQVNGLRGFTSIEERTRYDVYYIENWSLLIDIKIIFKTFGVVIKGREAY